MSNTLVDYSERIRAISNHLIGVALSVSMTVLTVVKYILISISFCLCYPLFFPAIYVSILFSDWAITHVQFLFSSSLTGMLIQSLIAIFILIAITRPLGWYSN